MTPHTPRESAYTPWWVWPNAGLFRNVTVSFRDRPENHVYFSVFHVLCFVFVQQNNKTVYFAEKRTFM